MLITKKTHKSVSSNLELGFLTMRGSIQTSSDL